MKRFLFFSLSLSSLLTALPTDHTVVHGEVDVSQVGSSMHIQASDRAIINWKDFSVSQGELAKFIQPSVDAAVLNRVEGNKVSHILGQLQSNGHVFLVNPQGVIIGKDAIVDVGGFTASTLDLLNDDFLKNNLHFKGVSEAPVINLGTIHAWNGDVTLLGFKVEQAGDIKALNGAVSLVEGRDILLSPDSDERIFIRLSSETTRDGVGISNTGTIEGVEAHLVADGNLYAYAINQEGKVTATGIKEHNGRLIIAAKEGTVKNSGTLTSTNSDGTGGVVHFLGKRCGVVDGKIDVSGELGGGTVLIGGDYQGKNPDIFNAQQTFVGKDVVIAANAHQEGDGGKVILWADDVTEFHGWIEGRGGEVKGNGGFAEVSGKQNLMHREFADLKAKNGEAGMLLLDPTDITICTACPTTGTFTGTFNSFVPSQPSNNTIFNADLNAQLLLSSVVIDTASGTGNDSGILSVDAPINWSSNNGLILRSTIQNINANIQALSVSSSTELQLQVEDSLNIAPGVTIAINGPAAAAFIMLYMSAQNVNIGGSGLPVTMTSNGVIWITGFGVTTIKNTNISCNNGLIVGNRSLNVVNSSYTLSNVVNNANTSASIGADSVIFDNFSINAASGDIFFDVPGALSIIGNSMITTSEDIIIRDFASSTRVLPLILVANSSASGDRLLWGGSEIIFRGATLQGNSAVNIGAEHSMYFQNGTTLASNGPVRLLVDGNLRHPLRTGTGSFNMQPGTSIVGDTIDIWTARQQFNNIKGLLNGSRFTPGPLYVNSALEHWQVFFPQNPLSGSPFAIYYEDGTDLILSALTLTGKPPFVVIAEMLRDLHSYDEFLVLAERFETLYDREGSVGEFSSFESGEDRRFFIRRPTFYDNRVPLIPQPRKFFQIPKEDEQEESHF